MFRDEVEKRTFLFKRLILMLHTAAMQQLGKLTDPVTGESRRDLEQAALTIDTLDLLREKCEGKLSDEERNFFKTTISELKLNYVDEIGRPENQPASKKKSDEQQSA